MGGVTGAPSTMSDPPLTPRRRLPDVALPLLAGGGDVPLRAHRRASVLFLLDGIPGEREGEYLRQLADAEPALRDWDGRVLVVVAGDGAAVRAALEAQQLPLPVLADPERAVLRAAAVVAPALVVADQWGEVHVATQPGPGERWLPVAEVEQWLRFLAVRCAG